MENKEEKQTAMERSFEQNFMANVKNSNNATMESSNKKKTRNKLVIATSVMVAVIVVLIFVVIVVLNIGSGDTAVTSGNEDDVGEFFKAEVPMVKVFVAPSSAKVLIDGEEYENGEYEFSPGEYNVSVVADGFEPYTGIVIVGDKHKSYVMACLQPTQGNESYYDNNANDLQTCQSIDELVDVSAWDQNTLVDGIFKYTPYHNDEDGYYVDPYFDEDGNVIVELTFKDCSQTEAVLEERAYAWMEEQGFDRFDYTFEKTWDCED